MVRARSIACLVVAGGMMFGGPEQGESQTTATPPTGHPALADLDYLIGSWELTLHDRRPDGSMALGRGRSDVYYILDGYAIQDDFRALDAAGRVVFRGTSIRTYDPRKHRWYIKWQMVDDPGYGIIEATFDKDADVLRTTGYGTDLGGEFRERAVYRFLRPDRYVFEMDRSFDGGKTWITGFNKIEAVRLPTR